MIRNKVIFYGVFLLISTIFYISIQVLPYSQFVSRNITLIYLFLSVIVGLGFPITHRYLMRENVFHLKGLIQIILIITFAQLINFAVNLWITNDIKRYGLTSLLFFGSYLLQSVIIAFIFFTIGYFISKNIIK